MPQSDQPDLRAATGEADWAPLKTWENREALTEFLEVHSLGCCLAGPFVLLMLLSVALEVPFGR